MTVVYDRPAEPDAFVAHYRDVHAPLVAALPNLLAFEWGLCESPDGTTPDHFLIAVLDWESKDDALASLGTDAGRAAGADVANFAKPGEFHTSFAEVTKVV
ncbi:MULTISPECIES: EthD family reductase [Amycolatopsis]|nr:EthD family reductase [Amycolatopsis sacchari]